MGTRPVDISAKIFEGFCEECRKRFRATLPPQTGNFYSSDKASSYEPGQQSVADHKRNSFVIIQLQHPTASPSAFHWRGNASVTLRRCFFYRRGFKTAT